MESHFNLRNYFAVLVCLAVLGTVWNSSAFADCELAKLLASDGAQDDWFGYSVSVSGDTTVIGAYRDDDNGSDSGLAYIFRFNGSNWVQEAKLLASDGAANDYFGISVGISGDTAVIGASNGSAYIFRFNGSSWVQESKLLASDGALGQSVGISGDAAVIGASNGSAYIFRFNGSSWVQESKLLASDGALGQSVGISGDAAVIGASGDDDNGEYSGSAYIFRFNGSNWIEEAKLLASDGAAHDSFGISVGIWGDTAVIGAVGDDDNGNDSGSSYIFRFNGSSWVQEAKLLASDGAEDDYFGWSVGI